MSFWVFLSFPNWADVDCSDLLICFLLGCFQFGSFIDVGLLGFSIVSFPFFLPLLQLPRVSYGFVCVPFLFLLVPLMRNYCFGLGWRRIASAIFDWLIWVLHSPVWMPALFFPFFLLVGGSPFCWLVAIVCISLTFNVKHRQVTCFHL